MIKHMMTKKSYTFWISLCFCACMQTVYAQYTLQDDDVTISMEGVITAYSNNTEKNIIIPDTLQGNTVTTIGGTAFRSKQLTTVTIPASVVNVAEGAFQDNSLTRVTFKDDSQLEFIGENAFNNNDASLTSIKLPTSALSSAQYWEDMNGNSITIGSNITDFTLSYILILTDQPYTTITSTESGNTTLSPFPISITFGQPVSGFELEDVNIVNGIATGFSTGVDNAYIMDIYPLTDGIVEVSIPAGVAKVGEFNDDNAASNTLSIKATVPQNALDFDGSDDYINVPGNNKLNLGTGNFTIEFWIKSNSTPSALSFVLSKYGNEGSNSNYNLYQVYFNGNDKLICGLRAGMSDELKVVSNSDITVNTWHHIAIVRDVTNNRLKLYVDGVKEDEENIDVTENISLGNDLYIGTREAEGTGTEGHFNGLLDEVRIWNIARRQQEIQAHIHKQLVGNEEGLIAYYTFNQGIAEGSNSGNKTLVDISSDNHGTLNGFALSDMNSNWVEAEGRNSTSSDPTITASQTFNYTENQDTGYEIGTVEATDDVGVTNFNIASGNANGYFDIDNNGKLTLTTTGAETDVASNDYETTPNSFTLSITASDDAGNTSTPQSVNLNVTNLNDNTPVITSGGSATSIAENSGSGQKVYTVTASDMDEGSTLTYALAGIDEDDFNIDANSGVVTLKVNPDYETKAIIDLA